VSLSMERPPVPRPSAPAALYYRGPPHAGPTPAVAGEAD
jgi:hypothetical protein